MLSYLKNELYVWRSSLEYYLLNRIISFFPSCHIRKIGLAIFGVKIYGKVSMFSGFEIRNPKGLIFQGDSSVGPNVLLDARKGLIIGKNVTIARNAMIWTLHHDYNDSQFKAIGEKVIIGDYAWICSGSIILPGVSVGEGAIVASGAVVTKSVEPYSVVAGVPAKQIGLREKKDYKYSPYYRLHIV